MNIYSALKKAFMLAFFFVGVSHNISANKIELADDAIKIYGIGDQISDGSTFRSTNSQPVPARIQIDELAIAYTGRTADILTIVKNRSDTLYSKNSKDGIIPQEIENGIRFYIDTDAEYSFTHGDKSWKLVFHNEPNVEETINETPTTEVEEQIESVKQEEGVLWWQKLLIALAFVAIALCGFICYKKGFFKFNKKGDKSQKGRVASDTDVINTKVSTIDENPKDEYIIKNEELTEEAKHEVLNCIIDPQYQDLSIGHKLTLLKQQLSSRQESIQGLATLKRELGLDEECTVYMMVEKIKSLDQKESAHTKEQYRDIREEVSSTLITKIIERGNKTLNSLVEKSKAECNESKDYYYDSLLRFFKLLPMSVNSASSMQNTNSNNMDFDHLMHTTENRRKMMRWAIEQIEDRGYKDLDKNKAIDENFRKIATLLSTASTIKKSPSRNDIVDAAILKDQLTEEQKKVLLRRLIEKVNDKIIDDSAKLELTTSLPDFVVKVAEKVQTPSTYEEAENMVRTNNLNAVNELLESNVTDFDKKSLASAFRSAIVKLLNKQLKEFDAESYEDTMSKLALAVSNSKAVDDILKQFNASGLSELPQAIREKQASELFKSVDKKVNELLPDKHIDSIQKLVNALIKLAEDAKDSNELIAGALEEKISMRDTEFVASNDTDVIKLINTYDGLVSAKEKELSNEISDKDLKITNLKILIAETENENSTLSDKNKVLMSETNSLIDSLHFGADNILENCKTILNPCSDNDESQCVDIEDRLFEELNKTIGIFKSFNIGEDVKPADARTRIQELLIEELSKENNPINTVCRYYAYSRLPFMTDTSREYGITFNRKNMSELFNSIESLYVQFGINLNIPNLFVVGFEEGNFENLTGQTYGDLDNLCQNSRNHFDNIDSNAKPSNVIVDVVNVGYTVDGKERRITSVLTY